MTEIIDFLQKLGQDARLRHAGYGEIRAALAAARIDKVAGDAILAGDERTLAQYLAAPSEICCLIFVPRREDEEPEKDDEAPEQDAPDGHGPESQHARRVA